MRLKGALFLLVDATCPWCVDIPRATAFADIILPGASHVVSYHIAEWRRRRPAGRFAA